MTDWQISDFHTHRNFSKTSLASFHLGEEINGTGPYTLGLHPWFDPVANWAHDFEAHVMAPNCVGLGEIGLDDKKGPSLKVQEERLDQFLTLATHTPHRLYVFHAVGAFEKLEIRIRELFKLTKQPAALFHDYSGSLEFAKKMLSLGPCFFSYSGKRLQRIAQGRETKTIRAFKELLPENLALETDDGEFVIEEVYKLAEQIRGGPLVPNKFITNYFRETQDCQQSS